MKKEYTFLRDGVEEKVELERWAWGVVYKDGTELHQFDGEGRFHQFKEIDQSKVDMFVMHQPEGDRRIDMPIAGDVQIFHFYRHYILDQGGQNPRRVKVYVFGWKDTHSGVASYNYILPDERILTSNHDLPTLTSYQL